MYWDMLYLCGTSLANVLLDGLREYIALSIQGKLNSVLKEDGYGSTFV
jgi:hypothetical protein